MEFPVRDRVKVVAVVAMIPFWRLAVIQRATAVRRLPYATRGRQVRRTVTGLVMMMAMICSPSAS